MSLSGLTDAAGRIGESAAGLLADRLELLALETREAKIRLLQLVILTCFGVVFTLLGCVLLIIAALYTLPPEWRLYGAWGAAAVTLLAGLTAMLMLRSRLKAPLAYAQTVAELKKDAACFSTAN